ncbi:MAG: hypothetical protein AMS24_00515 [Chlamydiae bacterium SM23_39]|nr:MAG: hypothetical protein AMS24_00515 [Chlamydiae bacterium SM23_39]
MFSVLEKALDGLYYAARIFNIVDKGYQAKKSIEESDGVVKIGLNGISLVADTVSLTCEIKGEYISSKMSKLNDKDSEKYKEQLNEILKKTKKVFVGAEITSSVSDTAKIFIEDSPNLEKIRALASTIIRVKTLCSGIKKEAEKKGKSVKFTNNWEKGSYLVEKVPQAIKRIKEYVNSRDQLSSEERLSTEDSKTLSENVRPSSESSQTVSENVRPSSEDSLEDKIANDVCPISLTAVNELENPLYYVTANGRIIAYESVYILTWLAQGNTRDPWTNDPVIQDSYKPYYQ